MKNKKVHITLKRVIGIFLLIIIAFSALSMAGSVVIFGVLFHRVDSLDRYVEITYALAKSNCKREQISFDSGGNRLSGYLYSANDPKGLVIIAPGMNSNSDSHLAEIMFFADNGYRVLAYDATGVCQSEGDSTVGLQQSKRDLLAAIDYAKNDPQTKALPVYLYGHSLGGYAVAAALDEADVRAAVCLSGFNSPVQTMHGKAKEYGLSLYSHESEITNVNAKFVEVNNDHRDGHTNLWLCEDSAKYMSDLQNELNDLNAVYDGEIPQNVRNEFYGKIDVKRAMKLDKEFMDKILTFMD